jgi:hypothetical protein
VAERLRKAGVDARVLIDEGFARESDVAQSSAKRSSSLTLAPSYSWLRAWAATPSPTHLTMPFRA